MLSDSRKSLGLHELQTEDYQTLEMTTEMTTSIYTYRAYSYKAAESIFEFGCHLQSSIFDACSNFKNCYVDTHLFFPAFFFEPQES